MIDEIEKIHEDVLSFTDDVLRLNNSSRPQLDTKVTFYNLLEMELRKSGTKMPEGEPRAFISDDLIIHLNQHALEGDLFKDWSATAIAFFQPYAFFLERTDVGEQLRNSGKLGQLSKECHFPDGIGRWVEKESWGRLKARGYDFDRVQFELIGELKSHDYYRSYEICEKLWKSAETADLSRLYGSKKAEPNEIIVASILLASTGESRDFNASFLELENMSIPQIFVKSGLYMEAIEKPLVPSEELETVEKYIKELGFMMAAERPIGDVREALKRTEEKLLQLGKDYEVNFLTELGGRALKLYGIIENHQYKLRIEEIPDSKTYIMLLQTLLNDSKNSLERYSRVGKD